MTANILASRHESFRWLPECSGVDGPRLAIEHLRRRQRRHRGRNCLRREMKPGPDPPGGVCRLTQALDAAQAASGWAREMPTPHRIRLHARVGDPHPKLNTELAAHDLQV